MTAIDQVLLTRFNLPTPGPESMIRAKPGWLVERLALFERYCLPSVRAQTVRDFSWIIYFDPASPDWLIDRVEQLAAAGDFTPIYRESVDSAELVDDLHRVVERPGRALMTSNLDNDDAIAVDFLERLRRVGATTSATVAYLVNGIIKTPAGVFRRVDKRNAFCSVVEPWDAPRTCWADWHNRLPLTMPAIRLGGAPGWLQVVHGGNVSNRVHGTLCSPRPHRTGFPGLLDDVAVPSASELIRDRMLGSPARIARDGARALAKSVALAALGKDGLTRAKGALARVGRAS